MKDTKSPTITFKNKLDINKLVKGLEKILSNKYNADIKITVTPKNEIKENNKCNT